MIEETTRRTGWTRWFPILFVACGILLLAPPFAAAEQSTLENLIQNGAILAQAETDADEGETEAVEEKKEADKDQDAAKEEGEEEEKWSLLPTKPPKVTGNETGIEKYKKWVDYMEYMAMNEMDLWGGSATVPEGFMIALVGWGTQRPGGRFDEDRHLTDLLPILEVPDPFHVDDGRDFFRFDFRVDGTAHGFFGGLMYGINDRMTIGVSTLFTILDIKMSPVFEPGTCERLGVATLEEFYTLLELLGRPRPKHSYRSDPVDWGDTTVSFTYNYFRNDWFSTAFTANLNVPTGHRAKPNESLIFGLGPDIDTGASAWGIGLNKVFDFRPPAPLNVVTFTFSGEGMYFFQAKRKSPRFIKPDQDVWDYMSAQGVELDFLPDLSDMDSHYYYTPPPWVAASGGIGTGPISITYRHGWGFESKFDSNSPGFKKMLDELGLVGTGDDGKIIVAASLPLTPLYIPAIAQFRFTYVTDGRNNIVFRDIVQAGIGFMVPLNPPDRYKLGGGKK